MANLWGSDFSQYIGVVANLVFALGFVAAMLLLNRLLGPKTPPSAVKLEPFECGSELLQDNNKRMSVKFYLIAILFVLFDVDVVMLYPWATVAREIGVTAYAAGGLFLVFFIIGDLYCWRKGALEWK